MCRLCQQRRYDTRLGRPTRPPRPLERTNANNDRVANDATATTTANALLNRLLSACNTLYELDGDCDRHINAPAGFDQAAIDRQQARMTALQDELLVLTQAMPPDSSRDTDVWGPIGEVAERMSTMIAELQDKRMFLSVLRESRQAAVGHVAHGGDALAEAFPQIPGAFPAEPDTQRDVPDPVQRREPLSITPGNVVARGLGPQRPTQTAVGITVTRTTTTQKTRFSRPANTAYVSASGPRLGGAGTSSQLLTLAQVRAQRIRRFGQMQAQVVDPAAPRATPDADAMVHRNAGTEERTTTHTTLAEQEETCSICADDVPLSQLYTDRCTARCEHDVTCCWPCLHQWIKTSLEATSWDHAKCLQCPSVMTYQEISLLADPETFFTYDRLLARRAIGEDSDFRWCTQPGCGNGQIHADGERDPVFNCLACGRRSCIVHNVPWHDNQTCAEYENDPNWLRRSTTQRKQEKASVRAVKRISKTCPGPRCDQNIQKSAGCDHITCSRCRYEFCWRCLADYSEIIRRGSSAHKAGCPHYRSGWARQEDTWIGTMHDPRIDDELGNVDEEDDPEDENVETDDAVAGADHADVGAYADVDAAAVGNPMPGAFVHAADDDPIARLTQLVQQAVERLRLGGPEDEQDLDLPQGRRTHRRVNYGGVRRHYYG
ncbi:hypothetical protein LTR65_002015 [Meristemomyces frigidus]